MIDLKPFGNKREEAVKSLTEESFVARLDIYFAIIGSKSLAILSLPFSLDILFLCRSILEAVCSSDSSDEALFSYSTLVAKPRDLFPCLFAPVRTSEKSDPTFASRHLFEVITVLSPSPYPDRAIGPIIPYRILAASMPLSGYSNSKYCISIVMSSVSQLTSTITAVPMPPSFAVQKRAELKFNNPAGSLQAERRIRLPAGLHCKRYTRHEPKLKGESYAAAATRILAAVRMIAGHPAYLVNMQHSTVGSWSTSIPSREIVLPGRNRHEFSYTEPNRLSLHAGRLTDSAAEVIGYRIGNPGFGRYGS
nr:hypothetical protein CFP56_50777 [Quercus suber]